MAAVFQFNTEHGVSGSFSTTLPSTSITSALLMRASFGLSYAAAGNNDGINYAA